MEEHPIQGLMKTAMESIKEMVKVSTVVGDPVEAPDGSVIVPVSRVTFGFAAGGGDFETGGREGDRREAGESGSGSRPFGGGSGAGVSVQPVGFLVVGQGTVRMLPVHGGAMVDRLIESAPAILSHLRSLFRKGEAQEERATIVTPGSPEAAPASGSPPAAGGGTGARIVTR